MVNTYVSLSSHERHVSLRVSCKREADGSVTVRNLYGKKKGNVWAGDKRVRCNSLLSRHMPTFLSNLLRKTHTRLKTASYQLQRLITDLSSAPTGRSARL